MAVLADSQYLQNIDEYVQDENKIVTYKWLSRTLSVPTNAAKKMLYAYVKWYRSPDYSTTRGVAIDSSGDTSLSVIYLISGEVLDETNNVFKHKISLISEEQLEEAKSEFSKMFCIHVYSVQRVKPKDFSMLYASDYQCLIDNLSSYGRWNTIDCKVTHQEPSVSLQPLLVPLEPKSNQQKSSNKKIALDPIITTTAKPIGKKKSAKGSVASFFPKDAPSAVSTNTSAVSSESKSPSRLSDSKSPLRNKAKQKEAGRISQFMTENLESNIAVNKDTQKPPVTKKSPEVAKTTTTPDATAKQEPHFSGLHDSDIEDGSDKEDFMPSPKKSRPAKSLKLKRNRPSNSKKSSEEKKVVGEPKKRRRIQGMSSDESDSDTPKTKEEEKPQRQQQVGGGGRRKRVKRWKTRMYTEEDGSMVTERYVEEESTDASDNEVSEAASPVSTTNAPPDDAKKEIKLNTVTKKSTKQSNLMSFFKK